MVGESPHRGAAARVAPVDISWEQALSWRMRRQYLVDRAPAADFVTVVDRMCGLHAQLMSSVESAVWARTDGLSRDAVHDALWRERTLVKLWAMRKTLHVFPSARMNLWLAGLATYRDASEWYGLRDPFMLELADVIGRALHGRVLTRTELATEVGRLSGSAEKEALMHGGWGGYLKPASFLGKLCFAPSDGRRVRFTHPDTWLNAGSSTEKNVLATIAGRYLGAHGPASPAELAGWWGVTRAAATRMLTGLGEAATRVNIEGEPYWMLSDHIADVDSAPVKGVIRLLPAFDQWVVCACRRDGGGSRPGPGEPALNPAYRTRVYRRQGWVSPVLLVDGRIEGVWKHQRNGRRLRVEIEPFRRLPRTTTAPIRAEAERLAAYFGADLDLAIR